MTKVPNFKNTIKEFIPYVGDRSGVIIDMFRSDLRRELRKAYRQGYLDNANEVSQDQDIFDNAG